MSSIPPPPPPSPPPPPPPRPFDQEADAEEPPEVARRPIVVNDGSEIYARYIKRIRLLDVFARAFIATLAVCAVVLAVRWVLSEVEVYNDPEPPATVPPPSG